MKEKAKSDQYMMTQAESDGETFKNILEEWDSDDGICSGQSPAKTCKRIGKIFLFLICFFGLLIMFSVGVMVLFNNIFNRKKQEEPIFDIAVPGLIFEPQLNKNNALVHCSYDAHETRPYIKRMNLFMKKLNPMVSNIRLNWTLIGVHILVAGTFMPLYIPD